MSEFVVILLDIVIGLTISFVVSFYAYKKRSLAQSGMIASIVMGIVIYVTGGWLFTAIIVTFFISSSLLSKVLHKEHKKDSMRTYKQVLANGLVATIISILYVVTQDDILRLLFAISIAVSTADTWASELGRLSPSKPRHILTWKQVEPGRSGGISLLGTIVSLFGSILISAFVGFHIQVIVWGFLGSIVDSLLGTVQKGYITKQGTVLDDPPLNEDYTDTKGLDILSNNGVNFLSNLIIVTLAYFYMIVI